MDAARTTTPDRGRLIARFIAVVAGLQFVVIGVFAMVAPEPFFDAFATFEPYNAHFIHDLGAFHIGVGAALLAAAARLDGLAVGLVGGSTAAVLHLVSHVRDRDLGGNPETDIPYFALLAVALLVATWLHLRPRTRDR